VINALIDYTRFGRGSNAVHQPGGKMGEGRVVYEEEGKWYKLSSNKVVLIDGEDIVVLLGKKGKEFARVPRASVIDIVPVLERGEDYDVFYPSFKLADGTTTPVFREGSSVRKMVQKKCDALKGALGL
jgi:hypothetical protein